MVLYYYEKYSTKLVNVYKEEWNWSGTGTWNEPVQINNRYDFNTMTGKFTVPIANQTIHPKEHGSLYTIANSENTSMTEKRFFTDGTYSLFLGTAEFVGTNRIKDRLVETVTAEDGAYPADGISGSYWYVKKGVANNPPTLTLTTQNNATLYENDTFLITGTAKDIDRGDVVSVWYQVGNGDINAIESKVSDGTTSIGYALQLIFKAGKLQQADGTVVTGALAEGTAHKLKVWAEDNKGSKSDFAERTFYVVPNRPPSLTINPITNQNGMIPSDKVTVSGMSNDPDGNNVKAAYRLNGGAPVEIHNGPAGAWSFDLSMSALKDGENTVVVEVSDTYNVKVSRTVKINKSVNSVSVSPSVQRYQILTASSAKKVQFWVRRHPDQTLTADVSMTDNSDAESYAAMTLVKSINAEDGSYAEDEFVFETDQDKEKIILKLTLENDKPVFSISGALY